jgi:hypothetical protein
MGVAPLSSTWGTIANQKHKAPFPIRITTLSCVCDAAEVCALGPLVCQQFFAPERWHTQGGHSIGIGELGCLRCERLETKCVECAPKSLRVRLGWFDSKIQVPGGARSTVGRECVSPDPEKPHAVRAQQADKLFPFGRQVRRRFLELTDELSPPR